MFLFHILFSIILIPFIFSGDTVYNISSEWKCAECEFTTKYLDILKHHEMKHRGKKTIVIIKTPESEGKPLGCV